MKSYQHHIGDFDRATRHLTRIERSVYRDLLDLYYETEGPINMDLQAICRKIIARDQQESTAVEQVLNEFFTETPQGWYHDRCEEEIERYRSNTSAKAIAGKASAEAKRLKKQQIINSRSTVVQQPLSSVETEEQQNSTNHKPETINQEPIKHNVPDAEDRERVPTVEVMKLFNRVFDTLPEVKVFNEKRKAAVRSRWRENPRLQSLESWERFFQWIKNSDFLMGRTEKPWTGFCFDWLVSPTNFAKIIEGNYHRGQQ